MAPRLSNTRKPRQTVSAPPREAVSGDNLAAIEEANRIQLISVVSKLSAAEDAIEAAKAPLEAARKHRKQIIGLGKAAGFAAWELEARLAEMKRGTREMAEIEERERKHRRWLGIIDPKQAELMLGDKVPQDDKDEAHHSGEGYKAGLRQMAASPPPEVPARFVQAYMKAHERGLKEVLAANVPGAHRLTVGDQAAADFQEDNPEVDIEREARKLKGSGFMSVDISAVQENPPFEATEDELANQAGRPSNEANEEPVL
jgi:hypothetical protein